MLRTDHQQRLQTTQRKMLRLLLNAKRKRVINTDSEATAEGGEDNEEEAVELEPWSEFLQRTARWAEDQLDAAGQAEWLQLWRKREEGRKKKEAGLGPEGRKRHTRLTT